MTTRNFSAFVGDFTLEDFPKSVRDTIRNFVAIKKGSRFSQYGMVASELVGKADPHNLETARKHVQKVSKKVLFDTVRTAIDKGDKFVLLLNDRIIDGHHFLAKAERGGVTSSIPVLDLTPVRFQLAARLKATIELSHPDVKKAMDEEFRRLLKDPQSNRKNGRIRDAAVGAGALAAGGGVAWAGYRAGKAADAVAGTATRARGTLRRVDRTVDAAGRTVAAAGKTVNAATKTIAAAGGTANQATRTAMEAEKTLRGTRATAAMVGGKIIRASRFVKRAIGKLPGMKRMGLESRLVATIEFAREEKKRGLHPAAGAAVSGAVSGALLGAIPALRRGVKARTVLRSVATTAGASGAIVGGGTLVGGKILGDPKADEGAAYTKRAAVGGAVAGTVAGLAGGVLAVKTRAGRRMLVKASKDWRPARWARKGGLPGAAAIGAGAGGAVGAAQGADEGQQVDSLRNLKKDSMKKKTHLAARLVATIEFAQVIGYEGGVPLTGRIARDRYVKKMRDDDLDRRDANILRAGAAGAAVGLLTRGRLSAVRRAAVGAAAGGAAVTGVRAVTNSTKDAYGERSRGGKRAESLPVVAGIGAAGVLASRRLKPLVARRLAATLLVIEFGRADQPRFVENKQYANPLRAYGQAAALVDSSGNPTRLTQSQLVNAAWRGDQQVRKTVRRGGNLLRDVSDVAQGRAKAPGRKREWEKEWFRNTVLTAGGAGALLGHAVLRRKVPKYRMKTDGIERAVKARVGEVRSKVDKTLGLEAGTILQHRLAATIRLVELDAWANEAGWDVRDPRGKSARVFAPGAQKRTRRPKDWHEKVENQRAILGGLGVAGTVAGLAGGVILGRRLAKVAGGGKVVRQPKSWQKPGYRSKKVAVISPKKFRQMGEPPAAG